VIKKVNKNIIYFEREKTNIEST